VVLTDAKQMLEAQPRGAAVQPGPLIECIEACLDCAQSCTACADACLGEADVHSLVHCVRTCLDCADICATTERILSRQTEFEAGVARGVLQACAQTCRSCRAECERHAAHHQHCRICADACLRCEGACTSALSALAA
jgi:hypothetical protein